MMNLREFSPSAVIDVARDDQIRESKQILSI